MAIDTAYVHSSGSAQGLVKDGQVHHTDWDKGAVKALRDMYPSLPDSFAQGDDAAHSHPSGAYGFIKGDLVHHTDWGTNATKTLTQMFPTLPAAWQ